jgi:hypothetical protein
VKWRSESRGSGPRRLGVDRWRYSPMVPDEQREALVERDEVAVMFKRVADEPAAIGRGWVELEEAVRSLRGRKFYGAFDAASDEYRVCVQVRDGDEPTALRLELGSLPRPSGSRPVWRPE